MTERYYHVTRRPWDGGDLLSWVLWHQEGDPPCNLDYRRDDVDSIIAAHCPDYIMCGSHDLPCWSWDHCPGSYSDASEVALYATLEEAVAHRNECGGADILEVDAADLCVYLNQEGYPCVLDRIPADVVRRVPFPGHDTVETHA